MNGEFTLGDCMSYLHRYDNNHFDLAIVDVPFGIGEDGRKKRKNGVKDEIWDDKQPEQEYFDELFRVSKHQIIFGCNYLKFNQKDNSSGRIIWDKVNGDNDFSDCEVMWTSLIPSVRKVTYMWNGMMQGKSIREGCVMQGNKKLNEKRIQACQKPVILYRWLLQKYAKQGWQILDTHVGSASSLIACEMEGFKYTGFEKLESHYSKASSRLQYHLMQPQLF